MNPLHEASIYLMEHWDTYSDMLKVESEIDEEYLIPLLDKVKTRLEKHPQFLNDWIVETYLSDKDSIVELWAYPKVWEDWNPKGDQLGFVYFGSLRVSQLLAQRAEDRASFGLANGPLGRRDEASQQAARKLWEVSRDYVTHLDGFERPERPSESACFFRQIDRMALDIIQDEEKLVNFIVEGMLPIIEVVDKIKEDHFPANPGHKKRET